MITVSCHTNLDDYKREEWPRAFQCRPEVGDKVMSRTGKILSVVALTHTFYGLRVELHHPIER